MVGQSKCCRRWEYQGRPKYGTKVEICVEKYDRGWLGGGLEIMQRKVDMYVQKTPIQTGKKKKLRAVKRKWETSETKNAAGKNMERLVSWGGKRRKGLEMLRSGPYSLQIDPKKNKGEGKKEWKNNPNSKKAKREGICQKSKSDQIWVAKKRDC